MADLGTVEVKRQQPARAAKQRALTFAAKAKQKAKAATPRKKAETNSEEEESDEDSSSAESETSSSSESEVIPDSEQEDDEEENSEGKWLLLSQPLWNTIKRFLRVEEHGCLAGVSKSAKLLVEADSNHRWKVWLDRLEGKKAPHGKWEPVDRDIDWGGIAAPRPRKRRRVQPRATQESRRNVLRPVGPGDPVPATPPLKRLYCWLETRRICPGSEITDDEQGCKGCEQCERLVGGGTAKKVWLLDSKDLTAIRSRPRKMHLRSAGPVKPEPEPVRPRAPLGKQSLMLRDVTIAVLERYGSWVGYRKEVKRRKKRKAALTRALHAKGLELRDDSKLCRGYINGSLSLPLEEVVALMGSTAWLFSYHYTCFSEFDWEMKEAMRQHMQSHRDDPSFTWWDAFEAAKEDYAGEVEEAADQAKEERRREEREWAYECGYDYDYDCCPGCG